MSSRSAGRAEPAEVDVAPPGTNVRAMRADALQVVDRRATDVDAAVRVVDPVDRHLVDAQAVVLGQQEQLGVEEPPVVLDLGQQPPGHVGADRLEAALRVAEAGARRPSAG